MLTPGTRIGPYEVTALIGEGGMGKVWRAHHTALNRDDALKVLPEAFASDPDRLARFRREAQVLASLNHPNIAHVYGLEQADGVQALVMELVEGPTLADRIARGPIPVDEALSIARQVAEALEAAHEQAIIHRDLKPANVKVRPDGTVKVLDFGLAKFSEASTGPRTSDLSLSPTITSPAMMTGVGVLLGTAAYMSPEQAKGRPVDKRSDIWAFGCVLYEMLTGKRTFVGDEVSETLASVLAREPDWTALPSTLPPVIRALLRRCLEKDRRKRIADISTARFAIDEASAGATTATDETNLRSGVDGAVATSLAQLRRRMRVRLALTGAIAAIVVGASVGAGIWYVTRPTPPRVVQLAIPTTPATALTSNSVQRNLAITRDGSRIVYVGDNGSELFVRALDALEPVSLYKGAPRGPFVSPDGQWVGFFDDVNTMKKIAITGGPAVTVTRVDGNPAGSIWTPNDTIVFATLEGGLQQVSAGGGRATVLTRPDRARGEAFHAMPELVPGGHAVLFTVVPTSGSVTDAERFLEADATQVAVLDLQTHTQRVIVRGGSQAHYVASGHLVYASGGALRAIAFDPVSLTTHGTSVPVVGDVLTNAAPVIEAVVANDGTLAYMRGTGAGVAQRTLVWVDRQGRETPLAAPPRAYLYPRISPDGGRVVVYANDQQNDLWIWDVLRLTLTRLTLTQRIDTYPVWFPDGRRLLFASGEGGLRNVFAQTADGTGAAEQLTTGSNTQNPTAVSPDGTRVLFTQVAQQTGEDVMQVTVTGTHTVTPLVQTAAAERNGTISPDGRWLAYEANASGSFEIYVRPYPDVASGRWQISTGGGTQPLWSHDGRELFYVSPANALMHVGVERTGSWGATTPTMLLKDGAVANLATYPGRSYDVAPDGRFLVVKPVTEPNAPPPQLIVVQHFDEMLKRVVPTK